MLQVIPIILITGGAALISGCATAIRAFRPPPESRGLKFYEMLERIGIKDLNAPIPPDLKVEVYKEIDRTSRDVKKDGKALIFMPRLNASNGHKNKFMVAPKEVDRLFLVPGEFRTEDGDAMTVIDRRAHAMRPSPADGGNLQIEGFKNLVKIREANGNNGDKDKPKFIYMQTTENGVLYETIFKMELQENEAVTYASDRDFVMFWDEMNGHEQHSELSIVTNPVASTSTQTTLGLKRG